MHKKGVALAGLGSVASSALEQKVEALVPGLRSLAPRARTDEAASPGSGGR